MKNKNASCEFPPLNIGKSRAELAIIQGGMGVGISLGRLASAVAKEGGIGVIASVLCGLNEKGFSKDQTGVSLRALKGYIREAKENSGGVIGVNIMVALVAFEEYVEAAVQAEADIIFCGAGLPLSLPGLVPADCRTAIAPIVSSGRAVKILCGSWEKKFNRYPDAIVVEGPKAGGHLGFKAEDITDSAFSLENLLADVIRELEIFEQRSGRKIPVIAAGGIYTGKDIYRILKKGASGAQMGTRFVATYECDASAGFKEAYIKAAKKDVAIIKSPVGLPGRALSNSFLERVSRGDRIPKKCFTKCLKSCKYPDTPYCIALALINAQRGKFANGFAFCGENVCKVNRIVSVKKLMSELVAEYKSACNNDHFS